MRDRGKHTVAPLWSELEGDLGRFYARVVLLWSCAGPVGGHWGEIGELLLHG